MYSTFQKFRQQPAEVSAEYASSRGETSSDDMAMNEYEESLNDNQEYHVKLKDPDQNEEENDEDESGYYEHLSFKERMEMRRADNLSVRLLQANDDSLEESQILEEALNLTEPSKSTRRMSYLGGSLASTGRFRTMLDDALEEQQQAQNKLQWMGAVALLLFVVVMIGVVYGTAAVIEARPPLQPVGPYRLIERQEGEDLFGAYTFYVGRDSVGSNGYNMYVDQNKASSLGIINVTMEHDVLDVYYSKPNERRLVNRKKAQEEAIAKNVTIPASIPHETGKEPFVYIGSSATKEGPRDSIRLEGNRRFDRGLFILDVRHMPAGCGVWPAFWLVDEPNWPVNGEIDIVEGVNYQTKAKTALHSTRGCNMDDIPLGTMTGTWDTAQGIPDKDTGIPDMTMRFAQNCFVYDPHQWLNQGCVAVDKSGGTIGVPLNEKGGGVYVLEWDPINRHLRSWVFTPHTSVPENLVQAIRTASKDPNQRVMPDPSEWPIPYAYFAIGQGTNCAADHFKHMHLVINTAFCGSVAGNRYQMDCTKEQTTEFPTCKDYIRSNPPEIQDEAYWKIRGVYVYEREWERTWMT